MDNSNRYRKLFVRLSIPVFILAICIIIVSCGDDDESASELQIKKNKAVVAYADLVYHNYLDALQTAKVLQSAVKSMTDAPNSTTYAAAKTTWLAAREPYGQSEAFRLYGGPIDDEDGPEGQLNAWPLDESYIDYVNGATNGDNPGDNSGANIINSADQFPEINASVIASLNEDGSESNVSSGYHAIEFLLWGQDTSVGTGGGDRSFTDYVAGGTADNVDRRIAYINATAELIVSDLQSLVDEWASGSSFRSTFTSEAETDRSLEKILNGIGKLSKGELAGERMFVAWDMKSKEDEHSCFSDNTHRDIVNNTLGIENVYYGRYRKIDGSVIDGVGIDEIVILVNTQLDTEMKALLETSASAVGAIQAPFDQEILGADTDPGRVRVKAGIDALRAQGDKLAAIASELGYTLDPDDI